MHILIGVIEKQGHWDWAADSMYPLLATDIDYFTEVHDQSKEDEVYGILQPYGIETNQKAIRDILHRKKPGDTLYLFDAHM